MLSFMKSLQLVIILMGLATVSVPACAQKEFFYSWENRVRSTTALATAVASSSVRSNFQPFATVSLHIGDPAILCILLLALSTRDDLPLL